MNDLYPRLRAALNRVYFALGFALGARRTLVGSSYFRRRLKGSDTLFVLAPGQSITRLSPDAFKHIAGYDSVGINSFVVHSFKPTFALLETHPRSLGLLDFMVAHPESTVGLQVLYKGYCSLRASKLIDFTSNLRQMRAMHSVRPWLIKEGYANDIGAGATMMELLDDDRDDRIYNSLGSVVYCLGLAYKAKYERVIICGVDFSADYFYDHNPEFAIDAEKYPFINRVSLIPADPGMTGRVMEAIKETTRLFTETGRGTVYQLECDGALADALPAYPLEA
jgi:hypothetical protein